MENEWDRKAWEVVVAMIAAGNLKFDQSDCDGSVSQLEELAERISSAFAAASENRVLRETGNSGANNT